MSSSMRALGTTDTTATTAATLSASNSFANNIHASRVKSLRLSHDPSAAGKYLNTLTLSAQGGGENGDANGTAFVESSEQDQGMQVEEQQQLQHVDDDGYEDYEDSSLENFGVQKNTDDGSSEDNVTVSVEYDDDDYANSMPLFHPNEEPPVPTEEENDPYDMAAASTIYDEDGSVKISKFDLPEPSLAMDSSDTTASTESTATVSAGSATARSTSSEEDSNEGDTSNNKNNDNNNKGRMKSLLENLMGNNKDDTSSEEESESARARRWSEWMTTGRKFREDEESWLSSPSDSSSSSSDSSSSSSDVALDQSLLSVDEGDDYVVVAVPAEAADGVGPILSSFPGGKRFQKAVRKTYEEFIANGDDAKNANVGANATTSSSTVANTVSPTVSIKKSKQKKKPKKQSKPSPKKKKQKSQEDQPRDIYNEHQRLEPGRISANDWRHNILNLASSTILRDVRNPVAWVFLWATLWSALYKWMMKVTKMVEVLRVSAETVPRWMGLAAWFGRHTSLPSVQHSMMVSAMSLLLVFRTNSAYQRFAEGRKIWNDIVDTTRDFSRMLKLYEFAIGTKKLRRINNLLASFPYLLRHRIRPSLMSGMISVKDSNVERDPENSLLLYPDESLRDTDPEVVARAYEEEETGASRRKKRELFFVDKRTLPWKLIPGSALELCARAQNRPLWVCDRMAKELAVVDDIPPWFTNRERMALINFVDKLSRSIGACERIHQTVVPLNYARHALRSLTVWLWTLPFVLVKDLGLLTGPVVAVVSWILFGVYEIGSRIEDPFQGTLRLSVYCDAIRRDVLADAIARDTAFYLEEETKPSSRGDGDETDAIFELESESEEYDGDENSISSKKKKRKSKTGDFLESLGVKI